MSHSFRGSSLNCFGKAFVLPSLSILFPSYLFSFFGGALVIVFESVFSRQLSSFRFVGTSQTFWMCGQILPMINVRIDSSTTSDTLENLTLKRSKYDFYVSSICCCPFPRWPINMKNCLVTWSCKKNCADNSMSLHNGMSINLFFSCLLLRVLTGIQVIV